MTLFDGKKVALLLILLIGLCFWPLGFLKWDNYAYKCQDGRYFSFDDWHVMYQVGRLQFRYHPVTYDCKPEERYDPKIAHPLYSQ